MDDGLTTFAFIKIKPGMAMATRSNTLTAVVVKSIHRLMPQICGIVFYIILLNRIKIKRYDIAQTE